MFFKLLIISVLFLVISLALLGIRMLVKRGGRFPETHVSKNVEMQKLGLTCAQDTDIGCKPSGDLQGCSSCGMRLS